MSFYDFIKGIFGIPDNRRRENQRPDDIPHGPGPDEFRNPIWNGDDDDDDDDFRTRPPHSPFGFRIFSDPIEIHKFFEQQMEEMLRNFQSFDMPSMFDGERFPALAPPDTVPDPGQKSGSLRDKYLKPGYTLPDRSDHHGKRRQDEDLDDRISAGELDKIFEDKPSLEPQTPSSVIPEMKTKSFGRSVVSKTVRLPDGTVEHHRTVRDSQGHEETTVTRQMGDQTYSVTTKIGPSGEEERVENFVNMQEEDLGNFEKNWFGRRSVPNPETDVMPKHNWFPFDKFFK